MKHFCFRSIDKNTVLGRWQSKKENFKVCRVGRRWVLEPIAEGLTLSEDDKRHILVMIKWCARSRWAKTGRL
jgi:hypothetical protein